MAAEDNEWQETHIAQVCIRQNHDFPNGPIRIDRPKQEANWWDITLTIRVCDGQPLSVAVAEVSKSA